MPRAPRIAIISIALMGIIVTFSCSDSEHRIPFGATKVVINLNLPKDSTDSEIGILEQIRRFLIPDAVAQEAPAAFSSILVRVTGPDIAPIEKSFTPYGSISMTVPAGSLRNFEVTAYVAPEDPSAVASYRGTAAANCPAGSTVHVPVVMGLNETRIIVPDYENDRIVKIDSMETINWLARTSFPGVVTLAPHDIDFDSVGRIYIANYGTPGVIRIDNMNGDNIIISDILHFGDQINITSIAVDRTNNLVYFATFNTLYQSQLDGTDTQTITLPSSPVPIEYIRGLGTDSEGNLYIAGDQIMFSQYCIYKCRIQGTTLEELGTPLSDTNLNTPRDVIKRGDSVYVINQNGPDNYKILRLTEDSGSNLQIAEHYGIQGDTTDRGVFYSPNLFLAIRNDSLIIGDSRTYSLAKLVSMDDMNGSGWTTFGTWGSEENQFKLWAYC